MDETQFIKTKKKVLLDALIDHIESSDYITFSDIVLTFSAEIMEEEVNKDLRPDEAQFLRNELNTVFKYLKNCIAVMQRREL